MATEASLLWPVLMPSIVGSRTSARRRFPPRSRPRSPDQHDPHHRTPLARHDGGHEQQHEHDPVRRKHDEVAVEGQSRACPVPGRHRACRHTGRLRNPSDKVAGGFLVGGHLGGSCRVAGPALRTSRHSRPQHGQEPPAPDDSPTRRVDGHELERWLGAVLSKLWFQSISRMQFTVQL